MIKGLGNSCLYIVCAVLISLSVSCSPQIHYVSVDVRKNAAVDIPSDGTSAVFSIVGKQKYDSVRVGNVAIGLAEKLEADRELERGSVGVWSLPKSEFVGFAQGVGENLKEESLAYLNNLAYRSNADMLYFVENLVFMPYVSQKTNSYTQYTRFNVVVPFKVDLSVYDALQDSLLYTKNLNDSLYLYVDSSISDKDMGGAIAKHLPDISKKIGSMLGMDVSPQWITQQRLIISYTDTPEWEEAYVLAAEFKWEAAIEKWMVLAESKSPKKAAFAAYNIAVGCEILEGFDLAKKWIDYSLAIYPFKEAYEFKRALENIK